jgi:hypothetical protein
MKLITVDTMLPGPEAPSPLIGQKTTAIFDENTLLFKILVKFRYTNFYLKEANFPSFQQAFLSKYWSNKIPLFFRYFWLKG